MIEKYIQTLREYALSHDSSCADGESILGMLYECHNENCLYDNDEIKADFACRKISREGSSNSVAGGSGSVTGGAVVTSGTSGAVVSGGVSVFVPRTGLRSLSAAGC